MAIGTITVGTVSEVTGTNPATSPGIPAGSGASDLMVIRDTVVNQAAVANQPATPAGWTLLDTFTVTNGTARVRHTWYWRVGAPGAAPSLTLTGTNATQHRSVMARIPGGRITGAAADIFTIGAQANPATSAAVMGPITGVTTPEDGCAVLVGAVRQNDLTDGTSIAVQTQQSGFTLALLDAHGAAAGENSAGAWAWAVVPTATAVTAKSFTATAAAAEKSIGQMIVVRAEPAAPAAPTVDAGADVPNHAVSTAFTRTATEAANGSAITARAWSIVSGPTGAGTTIGTAAALSWTPTVTGTYVLRYSATNGIGTTTDDMSITVAAGTLVWQGTAESATFADFDDPAGGIDQLSPQTRATVTSPVRVGARAYEHAVNGDSGSPVSQRSESVPTFSSPGFSDGYIHAGADLWFSASVYLPAGFPTSPADFQICMQWKNDGTGSPPLEVSIEGGNFRITGGFGHPSGDRSMTPQILAAATTGAWHDFLFHIVFSDDTAVGYIEVYRNGVQVLAPYYPPGGTQYPLAGGPLSYWKVGLYRGAGLPTSSATRVYHDELRVGTTRSVVELAPDQAVTATGVPGPRALGAPTVTRGAVALAPAGVAPARAVGAPSVSPGAASVTPAGVAPARTVGTPSVTPGAVALAPAGVPSARAVGTPSVSPTAVAVAPSSTPPARAVGSPSLTPGAVALAPAGVAPVRAVGAPSLTPGTASVTPAGVVSPAAVGAPSVAPPAATLAPASVPGSSAVGSPGLAPGAVTLAPAGIPSPRAVGSPAVAPGAAELAPAGVAPARTVGAPALHLTLDAAGVPTARAVGVPSVSPGEVALTAAAVPSPAAVGEPSISSGTVPLRPDGIAPARALGTPAVARGAVEVAPPGVPSPAELGEPALDGAALIETAAVPGPAAVGAPSLAPGAVEVAPAAVPGRAAVGAATLTPGPVPVAPAAVAPRSAVGAPALAVAPAALGPAGVPGRAAVGGPVLAPGPVLVEIPAGAPSPAAVGAPTLAVDAAAVGPAGVPSPGTAGTPTLTVDPVALLLLGVPSPARVGEHDVSAGDKRLTVTGSGVGRRAVGTPEVGTILRPTGVPATARPGRPVLHRTPRSTGTSLVARHRASRPTATHRAGGPTASHTIGSESPRAGRR